MSEDMLQQFLEHWRGTLAALAGVTAALVYLGKGLVAPGPLAAWGLLATACVAVQAWICAQMGRTSPAMALERWHPWMLVSVGFNSFVYGSMPLLVLGHDDIVVLSACACTASLLFSVVSSTGTLPMMLAAVPGIVCCGVIALAWQGLPWLAAGYAALGLAITAYGRRTHDANLLGLNVQYEAERLAESLRRRQAELLDAERERARLQERQRLLRDVHDGLGSSLAATLHTAERNDADPRQLTAMLRDCIDDLHTVVGTLASPDEQLFSRLDDLRRRLERQTAAAGLRMSWVSDDSTLARQMDPDAANQIVRIVQEAASNALRHAGAGRIDVRISARDTKLEIAVADDGCGFDPAAATAVSHGRGLPLMLARARELGGRLHVQSHPGTGTTVQLHLSIQRLTSPTASRR